MARLTAFLLKHKNPFWLFVALFVALAVAFALRVYLLSAQSLWNDEGISVALAPLSLDAITNAAAHDIHPPLYYYLLHFWMPFAGNTEYAIRFLSVIAGVLTVAVTFRLASTFFGNRVAIVAAFLAALSPFQVEYSQEARMYVWVMLFAAVSVWAMTMMLRRSGEWRAARVADASTPATRHPSRVTRSLAWLLYVAATIAMLYTQYFGAFVVVAENLAFVVWLVMAWRKSPAVIASRTFAEFILRNEGLGANSAAKQSPISNLQSPTSSAIPHTIAFWLTAQAIIALAVAPWYLSVREQLASWPSISEALDLPTLIWRVLNVFSVGKSLDGILAAIVSIVLGLVFVLGWKRTQDANVNWVIVVLILWTLVPVGAMYILSLSRPAYNPKFLLLGTPAFYILAARGLRLEIGDWRFESGRWRLTSRVTRHVLHFTFVSCALIILISNLQSLLTYYHDPRYARDNYRAILQFIDANARDGDGILINDRGQTDVVRYYHRGSQPLFPLPRMRPPDLAETRADVDQVLSSVRRLFAIYYATEQADPQRIIETRLAERAFKARDEWHGNVRLAVYGIAPAERGARYDVGAQVGDEIALAAFRLDERAARPGDIMTLTLNWRALLTPSARYKVFVHLLDANDRVVAQRDGEPVGDTRITTTWRAGETIADNYGILVEPGTPPGEYRIEIGMYRADNGARLPIGASDHLILGKVEIK